MIDSGLVHEKQGFVFLVQTDHISGEVIGSVINDLYMVAGVHNVQVIPSITKKNRPGYLFIVDSVEENNPEIDNIIVNELGATGWHIIETCHRHIETEILEHEVIFDTPDGPLCFTVKVKNLKKLHGKIRPEHSSCLSIRDTLRLKGIRLSLNEISQEIIKQLTEKK